MHDKAVSVTLAFGRVGVFDAGAHLRVPLAATPRFQLTAINGSCVAYEADEVSVVLGSIRWRGRARKAAGGTVKLILITIFFAEANIRYGGLVPRPFRSGGDHLPVHASQQRGWNVLTADPGRLRRVDPALELDLL
jgi:hypothetical protein